MSVTVSPERCCPPGLIAIRRWRECGVPGLITWESARCNDSPRGSPSLSAGSRCFPPRGTHYCDLRGLATHTHTHTHTLSLSLSLSTSLCLSLSFSLTLCFSLLSLPFSLSLPLTFSLSFTLSSHPGFHHSPAVRNHRSSPWGLTAFSPCSPKVLLFQRDPPVPVWGLAALPLDSTTVPPGEPATLIPGTSHSPVEPPAPPPPGCSTALSRRAGPLSWGTILAPPRIHRSLSRETLGDPPRKAVDTAVTRPEGHHSAIHLAIRSDSY